MSGSTITIRRRQTTAALAQGLLSLPGSTTSPEQNSDGSVVSPYFQTTDPRKEAPGRDIQFIFALMSRIAAIVGYGGNGDGLDIQLAMWEDSSPFTAHGVNAVYVAITPSTDNHSFEALVNSAIEQYAIDNEFTISHLFNAFEIDGMRDNSPQAAIADLDIDPSNADISTAFNTLLAELRTLGLIAS